MKKAALMVLGFFLPCISYAQVQISEIMYDLPGSDTNEWIEIENLSGSDIDISAWKLFESNANHALKIINGTVSLPAQGFAVIANDAQAFLLAYPNFAGTVFDSAFALSNSGETLVLRDASGKDADSVAYPVQVGAAGDGNSLQKIQGSWKTGAPTPGAANAESAPPQNEQPQEDAAATEKVVAAYTKVSSVPDEPDPVFAVSIQAEAVGTVATPMRFQAMAKERNLNEHRSTNFAWSMGDGAIKYGQAFDYSYRYPGTYVVTLAAEKGQWESREKHTITVLPAEISYGAGDGYVEIENLTHADADLSQWSIYAGGLSHVLPEGFVIASKAAVRVPMPLSGNSAPVLVDPLTHVHVSVTKSGANNPAQSFQAGEVAGAFDAPLGEIEAPTYSNTREAQLGLLAQTETGGGEVLVGQNDSMQPADADLEPVDKPIEVLRTEGGWSKFVSLLKRIFK